MSCQKVLSMLSTYIDGEVHGSDAAFIKQHLAQCASCAHEMDMLLRVSSLLQANAEVEPPASLLEQIEAATVGKPGLLERLRAGFAQVPQYARWAGAGVAAAALLVTMLVSQHQVERSAPGKASKPVPEVQVAVTPVKPFPEFKLPVGETKPVVGARRSTRRAHRTVIAHRPPVESPAKRGAVKRVNEHPAATIPADVAAVHPDGEQPADAVVKIAAMQEEMGEETGTVSTNSQTGNDIRLASADTTKAQVIVQEDPDALAQLRAKLAAASRNREYDTEVPRIEGNKHSVKLVGVRF